MEDEFSWTPLVIKHQTEQDEYDNMAQIKHLLEKGWFFMFPAIFMSSVILM